MLDVISSRVCPTDSSGGSSSDRDLLRTFATGEESAFTALVQRHAHLVLGVCNRILRHSNDAEDAFQATFLVLARKSRSLEWQDSIAGWLHQTARRTALKLREGAAKRRNREEQMARERPMPAEPTAQNPASEVALRELGEILDTELARLPSQFREVILLCQVEGLAREDVANRLGITVAAVKDRLERGRAQLRTRLLRRGVAWSAAALAVWLTPSTTQVACLASLAATTSTAAVAFATGASAAGAASSSVALAQGVLHMLGVEKLKVAAAWMVAVVTAGGVAFGMLRDDPARFKTGLLGQIVSLQSAQPPTITISLDGSETLLNLDVSPQAKIWTAFEQAAWSDLKNGQFVSLRLGEDHRTVNEIHVRGSIREATVKSVEPSGKLTVVLEEDDPGAEPPAEVELAPDAIFRLGGLPATAQDFVPGMEVPLEYGRDGKRVHAIEAETDEAKMVSGDLTEINSKGQFLVLATEEGDEGIQITQSFPLHAGAIILLDGKKAKLADLLPGVQVTVRLGADRSIRAAQATSPDRK